MKATVTYPWFVLLSIITCLERVNGYRDYYGDTPLQAAVRKKDVDLVKSLLVNGNDVKATNKIEQTALMIAAGDGSSEIMEILLPDSDVKATDKYGVTALMYAVMSGNEKKALAFFSLVFRNKFSSRFWKQIYFTFYSFFFKRVIYKCTSK